MFVRKLLNYILDDDEREQEVFKKVSVAMSIAIVMID